LCLSLIACTGARVRSPVAEANAFGEGMPELGVLLR
jgi:hypothetical protein